MNRLIKPVNANGLVNHDKHYMLSPGGLYIPAKVLIYPLPNQALQSEDPFSQVNAHGPEQEIFLSGIIEADFGQL